MTGLLLLSSAALLSACKTTAARSEALYTASPWPSSQAITADPNATQQDVARYLTRAKSAYDTCVANNQALQTTR